MKGICPTLWPTKEVWFITQKCSHIRIILFWYITNLKVGHSAILLKVSFRKRDRFRLPDKYVWWPARPKHTAVAFVVWPGWIPGHFFFGGGISSISRVANILGNFFVGGIRNRFVWLFSHLVGQPIVTWMQWFLHVGQNEVHQRLDGDHLYVSSCLRLI